MTRILLTGFEPFGGESMNPTMTVVERFADQAEAHVDLHVTVLPVDREHAAGRLFAKVEEMAPSWVLMLGEAGGRARITPERIAINVDSYRIPDNSGNQPQDEPVVPGGPPAYFTSLPVQALVATLNAAGLPAAVSNSAGTYLCNHVFYALMHRIEQRSLPVRAGFVHVPYAHEQVVNKSDGVASLSVDGMVHATEIMLETLRRSPPG